MSQHTSSIDLNRLSISQTTQTPPGFDGPAKNGGGSDGISPSKGRASRSKSTSFNNLAMVFGTGLAESIENSTSEEGRQQLQELPTSSNVDIYTRQSRHLMSRLIGVGSSSLGETEGYIEGLNYLNSNGPSRSLIPNLDSAYSSKLKGDREVRGTGDDLYDANRKGEHSVFIGHDYIEDNKISLSSSQQFGNFIGKQHEHPLFHASSMTKNTSDLLPLLQNTSRVPLSNEGETNVNESIEEASSALLEQNHCTSVNFLRHHLWQQSYKSDDLNASKINPIGVTVVEPPSRSSSAQQTIGEKGDGLLHLMSSNVGNFEGRSKEHVDRHQSDSFSGLRGNEKSIHIQNQKNFDKGSDVLELLGGRASAPPTNFEQGSGVLKSTLGRNNNAAIRAYTASSLQMRVAELHQELGAGGGNAQLTGHNVRTIPPGNVIVFTNPTPPPLHIMQTASREATPDPLINKHISRSFTPVSTLTNSSANHHLSWQDSDQQERESSTAEELAPFLRDFSHNSSSSSANVSSRGLAILFASKLNICDVRSTCEAFGGLEMFRSDFSETRGVYFATYYDLRSARLAVAELPEVLNQLVSQTGRRKIEVKYCVPLNSSSATDESMLLLSNLPGTLDESDLNHLMSSFGEIRAIHFQASMSDDSADSATFLVEFYDIQDARQALLELEQSNPWAEYSKVKVGVRHPTKRKQGRDLLVLMSSWRQGVISGTETLQSQKPENAILASQISSQKLLQSSDSGTFQYQNMPNENNLVQSRIQIGTGPSAVQTIYQCNLDSQSVFHQYSTQLAIDPVGNYTYVLIPNNPQVAGNHGGTFGYSSHMMADQHNQQQFMYAPNQRFLQNSHTQLNHPDYQMQFINGMPSSNCGVHIQDNHISPSHFIRLSSDGNTHNSGSSSGESIHSPEHHRSRATQMNFGNRNSDLPSDKNTKEDASLFLSIDDVKSGKDTRSSLMVRNIPNKYTQQMLLSEFSDAGHGSDKIDFFYLPIDFKNKCNRGYAFVNFVDCKDIIPFFDSYSGSSWKRFNSDKICKITYARIQGKEAMLKRFQNSTLMDKIDEYRPLIFVSHGEKKGQLQDMSTAKLQCDRGE